MTATIEGATADDSAWQNKAICDGVSDMYFPDVEEMVEDGLTHAEATERYESCTAEAKRICNQCPVKAQCGETAMATDEEWGVWGGMTPQERREQRPVWLGLKGMLPVSKPTVEHDPFALHQNSGVSAKLESRQVQAREIHDRVLMLPDFCIPATRRAGGRTRAQILDVMECILANPASTAEEIGKRFGKSGDWVNTTTRDALKRLQQHY